MYLKMNHIMTKPAFAICKHPCSLISAFVVRCLDSIIFLVSISKISSLCLASSAAQAGLCLTWWQTPKTGFLVMRLKWSQYEKVICIVSDCLLRKRSKPTCFLLGPVAQSDTDPLGMRTDAGSVLGSGKILSLRLVMK